MINVEDLSFKHSEADNNLINHLSFSVNSDDKVAIIGDNGSGKSTLLKLIIGIYEPAFGKVYIDGTEPQNISLSNIGYNIFYLPQEDMTLTITAAELYICYSDDICQKAISTAKSLHISEEDLREIKISDLSGGQRKKVYLSLAIAFEPMLLILDEPTNHLDSEAKSFLIDYIKARNGATLVVSHDSDIICLTSRQIKI